jgi:putative peptidoglycan lipid II flippase
MQKTAEVAGSTMLSRLLGLVREVLMANYLGVGAIADAFVTAFKIPNSLRKIFAEGALSVAFIPSFVAIAKNEGKDGINRLMTLALLLFEGFLLILCLLIIWKAEWVIRIIVPGWFQMDTVAPDSITGFTYFDVIITSIHNFFSGGQPLEQVAYSVNFLRILMSFILFLSTSALLAGALQAVNHFFIPAFSPVLLNLIFILGLVVCISAKLSPTILCGFIMVGGFLQFILHIYVYWKLGFAFEKPTQKTWNYFKQVWKKFLPCLFSMSVMEIYLFIDTSLGSYLPTGSIALIYYANRFMQIPLGVFATAFSTILLPHFSRVATYAPKRLGFYLLESAKLIFWIIIPFTVLMAFVSDKIFLTLFLSKKFTMASVDQASIVLVAFLYGLFFFSINKILLNIYYALHDTKTPMYISIVSTFINFILSYTLMIPYGAYGLALATTLTGVIQTILFVFFLHYYFKFTFYIDNFMNFAWRYGLQLAVFLFSFFSFYNNIFNLISKTTMATFFLTKIGFWVWFVPFAGMFFYAMLKTRKLFGIKLYFLD